MEQIVHMVILVCTKARALELCTTSYQPLLNTFKFSVYVHAEFAYNLSLMNFEMNRITVVALS